MCKTILTTEPIYRTYCGVYPLSPDVKDFCVFFYQFVTFCHLNLHLYVSFTLVYFEPPQVNVGDDTTEMFLDQVLATATICGQHLANKILMKLLTQEQWREYNNATNCSICAKPFKSADKRVRNHNHLTYEYRGPDHNACNLNYHTHAFLFNIEIIHPHPW